MHPELKRLVSITDAVFKTEYVHIITIHIPNSYVNKKGVQEIKAVKHSANTIKISEVGTYIINNNRHIC
jgi:hypothetical protein